MTKIKILLLGYNRPDLIERQLSDLRAQAIEIEDVYVAIDGPKGAGQQYITDEIQAILGRYGIKRQNTTVGTKNLGCRHGVKRGIDWFFSLVDEGLILEDDCQMGPTTLNFFEQSRGVLEHDRVFSISGSNAFENTEAFGAKIDESRLASETPFIWGWYTTRANWQQVTFSTKIGLASILKAIITFKSISVAIYNLRISRLVFEKKIDTWDVDVVWHCVNNNLLCVFPSLNQICNVGDDDNSTNKHHGNKALHITAKQLLTQPVDYASISKTLLAMNPNVARILFRLSLKVKVKLILAETFYVLINKLKKI